MVFFDERVHILSIVAVDLLVLLKNELSPFLSVWVNGLALVRVVFSGKNKMPLLKKELG